MAYAYIGHMFSKGFSVIDVRDPARPKPVEYVPAQPNTWNIHLQTHDDLLLVINAKDMFAAPEFQDEKAYYSGAARRKVGTAARSASVSRDWRRRPRRLRHLAGRSPREIGFMPIEGGGIHGIWYTGGRWAYVSALLDGFTDYIFITIDMSDPPSRSEAGRYWLPGMNAAAGETPSWPASRRQGCTTRSFTETPPIAPGAMPGWSSWTSRIAPQPKLHRAPATGRRHSAAARITACHCPIGICSSCSTKPCWITRRMARSSSGSSTSVNRRTRSASRPSRRRARPTTRRSRDISARTTCTRTGRAASSAPSLSSRPIRTRAFGRSTSAIAYRPVEVGALVPPAPRRLMDTRPSRPRVIQSADVFVDADGLIYSTDYNGGLYIMEFDPHGQ